MDEMRETDYFEQNINFPKTGIESYERTIRSATNKKSDLFGVVGYESDGQQMILLLRSEKHRSEVEKKVIHTSICGEPDICSAKKDFLNVTFIEFIENKWVVSYIKLNEKGDQLIYETVWENDDLCMYPRICEHSNDIYIIWAGIDIRSKTLCIYFSCKEKSGWSTPKQLGDEKCHSNRPVLTSNGDELLAAWDQSDGKKFSIRYCYLDKVSTVDKVFTLDRETEKWMSPELISDDSGKFYLSLIRIKEVTDPRRGILDHQVSACLAMISDEDHKMLPDKKTGNDVDTVDLREGLLAAKTYFGYYGLRRRPQPTITKEGEIWMTWELFAELGHEVKGITGKTDRDSTYGNLVGKRLEGTNWGDELILANGGTNFSVPDKCPDSIISTVYLDICADKDKALIKSKYIDPSNALKLDLTNNNWDHWIKYNKQDISRKRYAAKDDNSEYKLFWADTHTHSVFSPDAEGEPDELIDYAKNFAGLDIVAMVDNDYYPFFSLTKLKWKIQQALAMIFTENEKFLVFPGYEYTYHDKVIKSTFNHRFVIYPRYEGEAYRRIDHGSENINDMIDLLSKTDALAFAHHISWELTDSPKDNNVEVCSSWRVYMEEEDFIIKQLQKGKKFGFVGSSDTHRICPGMGGALTGIYAKELTQEAVFDAYKNHRTIATQGRKTVIDFRINSLFIGETGKVNGIPKIYLKVESEEILEFVEIICDGVVVKRYEKNVKEIKETYKDIKRKKGEHFYFIRVKNVGDPSYNLVTKDMNIDIPHTFEGEYPHNLARAKGPFAWSTPIWVTIA